MDALPEPNGWPERRLGFVVAATVAVAVASARKSGRRGPRPPKGWIEIVLVLILTHASRSYPVLMGMYVLMYMYACG